MAFSYTKRVERWLRAVDLVVLLAWCVAAYWFPISLQTTLAWVMGIAWYAGLMTVGGQNPTYLRPRFRIFVSTALALAIATVIGIFWAGSGREWYLKGGVHYLVALGLLAVAARLILSAVLQRPAIQLVPFRLPEASQPLLAELAAHPQVFVEPLQQDLAHPLPERRPHYPIYLVAADLRLRERDLPALLPLYAQAELVDICEFYESFLGKAAIVEADDGWLLPQALRVPSPVSEVVKRTCDVLFVLALSPLVLPVVALAALAVKLTSRGPALFRQRRLGRFGQPFDILKLRTMVDGAERRGPQWAGTRDARVTPLGRLLRASGIDELPQLWNVLRGEMSLAGPRPELPEIVEQLQQTIPFYRARLLISPGLTGWAQLHQGGDATAHDVANKLRYDLYYLKNASLLLDLRILLGTVQMVLHLAKPAARSAAGVELRVPTPRV